MEGRVSAAECVNREESCGREQWADVVTVLRGGRERLTRRGDEHAVWNFSLPHPSIHPFHRESCKTTYFVPNTQKGSWRDSSGQPLCFLSSQRDRGKWMQDGECY